MKVSKRNDAFARHTNQVYEPDTDVTCAVCGYGVYADDTITFNEHGEICHTKCAEEKEL